MKVSFLVEFVIWLCLLSEWTVVKGRISFALRLLTLHAWHGLEIVPEGRIIVKDMGYFLLVSWMTRTSILFLGLLLLGFGTR